MKTTASAGERPLPWVDPPARSERRFDSAPSTCAEQGEDRCVRSKNCKYFTVGSEEYLFDLEADPNEMINLASAGESAPVPLSRLREIASSL